MTDEYIPNGLEQWYFVPAIADLATPSPTEMGDTNTLNLTPWVDPAGISGFSVEAAEIDRPDLSSTFSAKRPGVESAADSAIKFFKSSDPASDAEAIRAALARGTNGFIVRIHPENGALQDFDAAGTTCEVFPVQVRSNSVDTPASNELARFTVQMTITARPVEDAVITV